MVKLTMMKAHFCVSLLLVPLLMPSLAYCESPETRLLDVRGAVYLHLAGQPENDLIKARKNISLDEGDQVVTGPDGMARIILDGNSIFELTEESEFTVQNHPADGFNFFLGRGSVIAKIKSFFEKKKTFTIRTPVAVASVRGTELAVLYDGAAEKSDVGVFDEGEVIVESIDTGERVTLTPGNETAVVKGLPPIAPHRIETLADFREKLIALRARRDEAWKSWRTRTLEERNAMRKKLQEERIFKKPDILDVKPAPLKKDGLLFPKKRPSPMRRIPSKDRP